MDKPMMYEEVKEKYEKIIFATHDEAKAAAKILGFPTGLYKDYLEDYDPYYGTYTDELLIFEKKGGEKLTLHLPADPYPLDE